MTAAEIDGYRTAKGGWSRAGLTKLGIGWPPPKGWRQALLRGEPIPRRGPSCRPASGDDVDPVHIPPPHDAPIRYAHVGPIIDRLTGAIITGPEAGASPLAFRDEIEALVGVEPVPFAGLEDELPEPALAVLLGERAP